MTRIVCLVCDVAKKKSDLDHAERQGHENAYCDGCGKRTRNREVASDQALIAERSALTFAQQRELFLDERRRA